MDLRGSHVFLLSLTLFSFLLPVAEGVEIDEKPLLHQIRNFPTAKERKMDIVAEIFEVDLLYACLIHLKDINSEFDLIVNDYGPKLKDITTRIIVEWMEGKGRSPVSWRTLISCLEIIGHEGLAIELRKEINGGLSVEDGDGGGDSDMEKHRQAFDKIIKESIPINVTVMRFVHIGLPRAGKTTTQHRLLGKMLDIISTQGDGKNPPSTAIESFQAIIGSIESENWSISMNLTEEAEILLHHFFPQANVSSTESSLPSQSLKNSPIEPAVDDFFLHFKEAIKKSNGTDLSSKPIEDRILLFNTDTGGQPEYIDLIAPLVVGPSLYFLYHRLNESLDKEYDIVYTDNKGNDTPPQRSTITVQDFLFQSLSAIESFSERALTHQSNSINSNVILVGTFRDKVSEDEVKERSNLLWEKIEPSQYRHMVQEISPGNYTLDVNNYNGSQEGIYRIRNVLSEIFITKYTSKVRLPVSWLILSLHMRMKEEPMMTFKECEKLAEGLYINSTILKEALWHFHHEMGIILYYEDLDMVISNVNILFNSIKELITSMKSFNVARGGEKKFISMAIFSERTVKTALTKQSSNTIPFDTLVKLLQHLNILTVTKAEAFSDQFGRNEGDIYFMPSLLQIAGADELDIQSKDSDPAHLLVWFKSGYVPVGVFSLMIVNLESQKLNDWTLDKSRMKKNKLGFEMKCNDNITFIARPKYIEIVISRHDSHCDISTESLCSNILSVIYSTVGSVTSNMKLDFSFGFKNEDFPPKEDYLCMYYNNEEVSGLECQHPRESKDYASFQPLNWQQGFWFIETIKSKRNLLDATREIREWRVFCEYLGVNEGVLAELDNSGKSVSQNKHGCLTDYYNNHNPSWRKVVDVIANYPIRNLYVACKIAKKYMKMERRECEEQFKPREFELNGGSSFSSLYSLSPILLLLVAGIIYYYYGKKDRARQVPLDRDGGGNRTGCTSPVVRLERIYQEHVSSIPDSNRYKLKEKLDFKNGNLDVHLGEIANSMINWREKLAIPLGLSKGDVHAITYGNQNKSILQQRAALQKWKTKNGPLATYEALLKIFVDAEENDCAEVLCKLLGADDGEKVTPTPEPANMAGSIQEPIVPVDTNMATHTQRSPVGHVGISKHRGNGGGNRAGRTQVPVSMADGNEARQRRSNRLKLKHIMN